MSQTTTTSELAQPAPLSAPVDVLAVRYASSFLSGQGSGWCATVWERNSDDTQVCRSHVKGYASRADAESAALRACGGA